MVKITIEGKEDPRIVTHPEVPQPVELIEQRNGQRVSVETCSALARGTVDPAGDGEAAELARSLWEHAGDTANVSGRWNGWQVAAWIATNDLAVVARLAGPIEFRGKAGNWVGERPTLHARTVKACLEWEIATKKHCRCGATRDGLCLCLDEAFGKLNAKLRKGELGKHALIELGQQSLGPVNLENAKDKQFASRSVQDKFPAPKTRGAPSGRGVHQASDAVVAAKILDQVAKGTFPNRGQAINAALDSVPSNSDSAKRKRLYRAIARIVRGQ